MVTMNSRLIQLTTTGFVIVLMLTGCMTTDSRLVMLSPSLSPPRARVPNGYGITDTAPRYVDGERVGLTIHALEPNSLASALGLKPGDVIVAMDGVPCTELRRCRRGARRVEIALHFRRPFELTLERQGRVLQMQYRYHPYSQLIP
jgi:membrane-associated protease RseP (regulator of RpoE activity)